MLADDKLSLSTHFMEHLPTLIEKVRDTWRYEV